MKRMKLRDVPDEVYAAMMKGAEANRQSLNSFVVDRLAELAGGLETADYLAAYESPRGVGVTLEDAAQAVRELRKVL